MVVGVLVATRHVEINDVFYLLADADISANVKINLSVFRMCAARCNLKLISQSQDNKIKCGKTLTI